MDNRSAARRAQKDLVGAEFTDTFDCIVCALLTDRVHPSYYPPFP